MLKGRNVLIGVTGSIAAYKATYLVRELIKKGASVKVVMTPASVDFITPLTLATLSKNPVLSDFTADKDTGEWNNHVDMGLWADLMIIAPATANSLAKMAASEADNLLLAVYLSAKCPVYFAPAMDLDMYRHPAVQENIQKLTSFGNKFIKPGSGELASGLVGEGRMAEPEEIVQFIEDDIRQGLPLYGKKLLITAGPTFEAIDPVRFIGNHSTGKMGFALADAAAAMGAEVHLVAGPVQIQTEQDTVNRVDVKSAQDMLEACLERWPEMDGAILSAAVADFRPSNVADQKIKKDGASMTIELEPTTDILKTLGGMKKENQLLVGFALETNNEEANAKKKLASKNLDLIVLNSLRDKGAGFGHDTNKVTLIDKNNKLSSFELKSKREVAQDILAALIDLMK